MLFLELVKSMNCRIEGRMFKTVQYLRLKDYPFMGRKNSRWFHYIATVNKGVDGEYLLGQYGSFGIYKHRKLVIQ